MVSFRRWNSEEEQERPPAPVFVEPDDPFFETRRWRPLPVDGRPPGRVIFIDGVSRSEVDYLIYEGTEYLGWISFVSLAAGALEVRPFAPLAERILTPLEPVKKHLILHTAPADLLPERLELSFDRGSVSFLRRELRDPSLQPRELRNLLMSRLEAKVLERLRGEDAFLLADGPLRGEAVGDNLAFLVKSFKKIHLPRGGAVLTELAEGERTPAFVFTERGVKKAACFVRLPGGGSGPLDGLVRLEVPAGDGALTALERAAAVALFFANRPHRDRRSPQNLMPIARLEELLRRRLGDQRLLLRRIEAALFGGA